MRLIKLFLAIWIFISNFWWVIITFLIFHYISDLPFWEFLIYWLLGAMVGMYITYKGTKYLHNKTVSKVLNNNKPKENESNN